jgi:hypothetical protein
VSVDRCIRERRSAHDFHPSPIPLEKFVNFLGRMLPSVSRVPYDCITSTLGINIGLFVYRVDNLTPGYYVLVRDPGSLQKLKDVTAHRKFKWSGVKEIPENIPLFLLEEGDKSVVAQNAAECSCKQNLVSQSAFCCCMFADIQHVITSDLSLYRQLHFECGMIGQMLYVEVLILIVN